MALKDWLTWGKAPPAHRVDKKEWMRWAEANPLTEEEVAMYIAVVERHEEQAK